MRRALAAPWAVSGGVIGVSVRSLSLRTGLGASWSLSVTMGGDAGVSRVADWAAPWPWEWTLCACAIGAMITAAMAAMSNVRVLVFMVVSCAGNGITLRGANGAKDHGDRGLYAG
jgi:hypothetical protein